MSKLRQNSCEFSYYVPAGNILHEYWRGVNGTTPSYLTRNASYPDNPARRDSLTAFETPQNFGDDYGDWGDGLDASLETDDLLVDVLAESSAV